MARTAAKKSRSLYSVHPGVAMMQDWVATLRAKTGKALDEWIRYVKKHGPPDEKSRRTWLKNEHGLGSNSAWWIAERAEGKWDRWDDDPESYLKAADKYVEDMFAGPKSALLPAYHRLLDLAFQLGKDVKACPCKTIVPLYRNHVFAQIKPATRTRIDLGFALRDLPVQGRLIDTGGFAKKDRITHRIPIISLDAIDDEVKHWLRIAYNADAKT